MAAMTATSVPGARHALLAGLIDHAALFPPASLGLPDALRADDDARGGPHAWLLGRFLCPASQLEALGALRPWEDLPSLGAVLDGAGAAPADAWLAALDDDLPPVARAAAAGARVGLVEVRLPAPALAAEGRARIEAALPGVEAHLEVPADDGVRDALTAVAQAGARAKVRCGGPAGTPPVDALATFVCACRDLLLPFKATAGLHAPLRRTDPATGEAAHGFLNLLAAAALAQAGDAPAGEVAAMLAEEDPAALLLGDDGLVAGGRTLDAEALAATRATLLLGFGSCSVDEPVEGLQALGVLPR
jgi:hypothetical protein